MQNTVEINLFAIKGFSIQDVTIYEKLLAVSKAFFIFLSGLVRKLYEQTNFCETTKLSDCFGYGEVFGEIFGMNELLATTVVCLDSGLCRNLLKIYS